MDSERASGDDYMDFPVLLQVYRPAFFVSWCCQLMNFFIFLPLFSAELQWEQCSAHQRVYRFSVDVGRLLLLQDKTASAGHFDS